MPKKQEVHESFSLKCLKWCTVTLLYLLFFGGMSREDCKRLAFNKEGWIGVTEYYDYTEEGCCDSE